MYYITELSRLLGGEYQIATLSASKDMNKRTQSVRWLNQIDQPTGYLEAVTYMERLVRAIDRGSEPETVWLLEHPSIYTRGTSASDSEIIDRESFPIYETGRGGKFTYHGPGQIVGYTMLDLRKRKMDIRAFVHDLEEWIIATLAKFSIRGERRNNRIGIWVVCKKSSINGLHEEKKIAAIGVRVRRWISYHGISINVEPDLRHFKGIIPCGIPEFGVTSLLDLGITATMNDVADAMHLSFEETFGRKTQMDPKI